MIYVLDTDILSLLAHQDAPDAPKIRRHIAELPEEDSVVTTVINYEEQMRGWMAVLKQVATNSAEVQIYDRLTQHVATYRRLPVLGYTHEAAEITEKIRKRRVRVGSMDLKIASIVLANDATIVTRNTVDFRKIEGLKIKDWLTA